MATGWIDRRNLGILGVAALLAACGGKGTRPDNTVDQLRFELATTGLPPVDLKSNVRWKSTPVLVDVNQDGNLDLAAMPRLGEGPRVWFGDGRGNWRDASKGLHMDTSCGGGLEFGDINQDGHLDLAVADHCHGVAVFLGDGDGHWQRVTGWINPAKSAAIAARIEQEGENTFEGAEDLALGDVNEDGYLDLVAGATNEGGLSVYLGDGSGKVWREVRQPDGIPSGDDPGIYSEDNGGWALQVKLVDINRDGHLDTVASYYAGPRVWLGDGTGHWQERSQGLPAPMLRGIFRGLAIGDINEDGRLDLAVGNGINGPEVALQNADGTWQKTPDVMPRMLGGALAVDLGDLNRDGHLDLVVGGRLDPKNGGYGIFVLLGNGKGGWQEQSTNLPTTGRPFIWGIAVGDVNHDGKPDFAVASGGAMKKAEKLNPLPRLQVWLNQN